MPCHRRVTHSRNQEDTEGRSQEETTPTTIEFRRTHQESAGHQRTTPPAAFRTMRHLTCFTNRFEATQPRARPLQVWPVRLWRSLGLDQEEETVATVLSQRFENRWDSRLKRSRRLGCGSWQGGLPRQRFDSYGNVRWRS